MGTSSRWSSAASLSALLLPLVALCLACGGAQSPDGAARFVEQELDQLSSPFSRETVLELNAIVARSLDVIEEFDTARREHAVRPSSATGGLYADLAQRADGARVDMAAAEQRLRQSGERFNEAILAAMVRFVDGVSTEIALETERL